MALTDAQRLRSLLGEEIPSGGSETDTLFSDEQINDLLTAAGGDPDVAVVAGWRIKAAKLADMVDVAEGNSSRALSDLHKNALAMVKFYAGDGGDGGVAISPRNVVIGTIARRR